MALPPIDPEASYDMRSTAAYLGVHVETARLLIRDGKLGGFRAGHAMRSTGADIVAFRTSGGDAAGVRHRTVPPPPADAGPRAGAPRPAPVAGEVVRRPRRVAPAPRPAAEATR